MKVWLGVWCVVLPLLTAACTVMIPEGRFGCANDGECPDGWSCVEKRCYARALDAGADTGVDGGSDAADDATIEAGSDADLDSSVDAEVDAGNDAGKDSGTPQCTGGFRLQGSACIDINECAFPVGPASSTRTAAQADSTANADVNAIVATDNWLLLNAHFREGIWSDDADLCGADQLTRDAFVRITLTRTTTLRLRARSDADTDLVMAVIPTNAPSFTLGQLAEDSTGAVVKCLSGSQDLSQSVRLAEGAYYVIVKANHRCDLDFTTCLADPNSTQDDPFSLEIRDLDLAVYPCDTAPLASCVNAPGGFRCDCPHDREGDGIGPSGCQ